MNAVTVDFQDLEAKVLASINKILLPRKSFDYTNGSNSGIPLILKPETIESAEHLLEYFEVVAPLEGADKLEIDAYEWDRWWAREHVAAKMAIATKNDYVDYLPGRFLHYRQLADTVNSLFGGNKRDMEGLSAIEIGSGSGLSLIRLAAHAKAHSVAFDISKIALGFSEYLAKHYGVASSMEFKQGDFYHLPFPDNHFNATYNAGVFEHLEDPQANALLAEMVRITKPQGFVLISIPNENSPFYKAMKAKADETNQKFKSEGYVQLPWEERRYPIDLQNLMEQNGLTVVKKDGYLIAPSSPVRPNDINESDLDFFHEKLPDQQIKTTSDKIKLWDMVTAIATPEQRMNYGWSVYAVGQKK